MLFIDRWVRPVIAMALVVVMPVSLLQVVVGQVAAVVDDRDTLATSADPSEPDSKAEKLQELKLAEGTVSLSLPARWPAKKPAIAMIEAEHQVPAPDPEDEQEGADAKQVSELPPPGRLTIMRSGGTIAQNIDRWKGQFQESKLKETELKVDGLSVKIVDITGTFLDRPAGGPFAQGKVVPKPEFRMLGAIVTTTAAGQYFVKLVGPQATLAPAERAFLQMVESIREQKPER